ncbi:MAG: Gfo/Idh/MocA family protein [Planctomycetota bacterium]|jgi:predicted dehydrogenase
MAKRKPIRTMVVGLGRIGWQYHITRVADDPRFEMVAAVETLAERRREAEEKYGCATFATIEKALKAGLAELAIICTRSVDHAAHSIKALRAGCHVFVDKPAALSLKEFDRMTAAARKAKRLLTVHQSQRANPVLLFVKETISSGVLGRVFWVRRSGLTFYRRNDWQTVRKYGGGLLNNAGVHHIDGVLTLTSSEITDVWGDLKSTGVCAGDADDFARASVRFKSGLLIEVEMSFGCAFEQPHWLVCGKHGSLMVDDARPPSEAQARLKYFDPKKAPRRPLEGPVPKGRQYRIKDKIPWVEKTVPATPERKFPDFYDNLYKAIRRGAKLLVTPESVRRTIHVMDEVRKKSQWKY